MAKGKIAKKVYMVPKSASNPEGESGHVTAEATELQFRFSDGTVVKVGTVGKDVAKAAFWHGLSQKIGDTYAGVDTVDEAIEAAEVMIERLIANEWAAEREAAGPRPSMVVEAVVAALTAAGQKVDDARRAKILEKLNTSAARAEALKDAAINAHYEAARAAKAAARAAEAKKKAGESKGPSAGLAAF